MPVASPMPAAAPVSAVPTTPPPPEVAAMLAEVSPQHLQATLTQLVGFGTRHTLSDFTSETRGIGAARRWIRAEMERGAQASGRVEGRAMRVDFDVHVLPPDGKRIDREVEVVNVVAVLPGQLPVARERRYYVVGHYDSRVGDVMDRESDAPGANDDEALEKVASMSITFSRLVLWARNTCLSRNRTCCRYVPTVTSCSI